MRQRLKTTTTTNVENQSQKLLLETNKKSMKDKTSKYNLSTLDKVTHPTIGNILQAQDKIAVILTNYWRDAT